MIDVTCSQCGAVYHSEESHVGKHLRCSRCGCMVPILPAPRSIVSGTTSAPPQVHRAARKAATRLKSGSMLWIAVALVVALASVGLIRHYRNAEAKAVSDRANLSSAHQPPAQQGNQPEWTVVHEEPSPDSDKSPEPADPRPTEYNSLPTGTRIERDAETDGYGQLQVENGNDEDAVVRLSLSDSDETIRWFFVRAHRTARIRGIPTGVYRLTFTTGLNWVESEDAFSWHPTYSEFERPVEFREQRDSEGVRYHSISVTLNAVPFGNIHTRTITREEFLGGHKHVALQ